MNLALPFVLAEWNAAEVTAALGAAGIFVAGVVAGVVKVMAAWADMKLKVAQAQTKADASADSLGRMSTRLTGVQEQLVGVAMQTPAPTQPHDPAASASPSPQTTYNFRSAK